MSASGQLLLMFILAMTGGCKPQAVSYSSEELAASPANLPKIFTSASLNGSCKRSKVECAEYRGLSAKLAKLQVADCQNWTDDGACPTSNLEGICFDDGSQHEAIFVYKGHASAKSAKSMQSFCGPKSYLPVN